MIVYKTIEVDNMLKENFNHIKNEKLQNLTKNVQLYRSMYQKYEKF